MRHIIIFERRKETVYKKEDYRAMSFEVNDEDTDLIQLLCDDWNNNPKQITDVDFMPIDMAILRHNSENDDEFRVASEGGLLMAYRGKRMDSELIIKILNLEQQWTS